MSTDEFTKLYVFMTKRFDALEAKIDQKADKDVVYSQLDGIIRRLDDHDTDLAIISHRLERLMTWQSRVSRHLGIKPA